MGFAGWFLSALLLLKIIVSMNRWYVGVLGNIEKCINFTGMLFKVVKILKGYAVKTVLVFPKTHYFEFWASRLFRISVVWKGSIYLDNRQQRLTTRI